jgi:hypothetical protein
VHVGGGTGNDFSMGNLPILPIALCDIRHVLLAPAVIFNPLTAL